MPHPAHNGLEFLKGCPVLFEESCGVRRNGGRFSLGQVDRAGMAIAHEPQQLFGWFPAGIPGIQFFLGDWVFSSLMP